MVLVSFWARILCLGTSIKDSSFSYVWMGKIALDRHRFVFWSFLKSPTKSGPEDICIQCTSSFFSVTAKCEVKASDKNSEVPLLWALRLQQIGNTIKSEILDSIDVCALAYVSTVESILQKQVELPTIPHGSFKMTFDFHSIQANLDAFPEAMPARQSLTHLHYEGSLSTLVEKLIGIHGNTEWNLGQIWRFSCFDPKNRVYTL